MFPLNFKCVRRCYVTPCSHARCPADMYKFNPEGLDPGIKDAYLRGGGLIDWVKISPGLLGAQARRLDPASKMPAPAALNLGDLFQTGRDNRSDQVPSMAQNRASENKTQKHLRPSSKLTRVDCQLPNQTPSA